MNRDELTGVTNKLVALSASVTIFGNDMVSSDLLPYVSGAMEDLERSTLHIRDTYYSPELLQSGAGLGHSDILANLILRTASRLRGDGHANESDILAKVNKLLHGIDFFPREPVPDVFMLVHPIGSIVGRIALPSFSVVYQGVSIGARLPNQETHDYPVFEGPVVFFSHASVFGSCLVGENVVFGAGSMVVGCEIPSNTVVVGQFPNHKFLPGGKKIIDKFFIR